MNSNDEPSLNLDLFAEAVQPPADRPLLERCKIACSYVKPEGLGKAVCSRCGHGYLR